MRFISGYKNRIAFLCCLCCALSAFAVKAKVSYLSPGDFTVCGQRCKSRLGDHLNTYIKARWFAYKADLPFYYAPFQYSDCFSLSDGNLRDDLLRDRNIKIIRITHVNNTRKVNRNANTLYLTDLFSLYKGIGSANYWREMRDDEKFMKLIRKEISPRVPVEMIPIPEGHFSIAAHVRKGGGVDFPLYSKQLYDVEKVTKKYAPSPSPPGFSEQKKKEYDDCKCPKRFPAEQYYIEQIKVVAKRVQNQPIYVFLFTDEIDTYSLVERFRREIRDPNITFDCHRENSLDAHVLEDFFSMMHFDCLIKPIASSFSSLAHFLGTHELVIYPTSYSWHGPHLVMKEIRYELYGDRNN